MEVIAMAIQSMNPATGETLETFEEMSRRDVDQLVERAHAAFLEWRTVPFATRAGGRPPSGSVPARPSTHAP
jgi:acyl-CoA reductase-like NAD-dependent aldehyde dehydrogenase